MACFGIATREGGRDAASWEGSELCSWGEAEPFRRVTGKTSKGDRHCDRGTVQGRLPLPIDERRGD